MSMARRLKSIAGIAAIVAIAATTGACGGSESSSGGGGGGGSGDEGGVIGISLPTVEGPFFTALLYGMNSEAKKLGYEVKTMDAGGYDQVENQVTQMENLMSQQVDAIFVDPADPVALGGSIKQAASQDIPVISTTPQASTPGAAASVTVDHCKIGKMMGEGAKTLLPDGGTLGVLAGPAGADWTVTRLKCFKQELQGSGIEIKAEKTSNPDTAEGLKIATDFLQRYPNLDLLYGADDTVGVGAAKAVQAAHRCGKTKIVTAVLGEQTEQLLRQGCIGSVVALRSVQLGRLSVDTAVKLIKGEPVEQKNIDVPVVQVTPDNVDDVGIDTIRPPKG
jgi:ABC-type sugar transport system substrate-binding protein